MSKKRVLRKVILICDQSKKYYIENWCKKETTIWKTDCLSNALAILEADGWIFRLRNNSHNYETILPRSHPTHQKAAWIKNVLESIANHAKTGAS